MEDEDRLALVKWRRWADNLVPPSMEPRRDQDARDAIRDRLATLDAAIAEIRGHVIDYIGNESPRGYIVALDRIERVLLDLTPDGALRR